MLQVLLEEGQFEKASRLARERPWVGPFDASYGEDNVPPQCLPLLHLLLDLFADALEETPPNTRRALHAARRLGDLVNEMR